MLALQVVVDFFAEWCGPCKVLAPKLDAMSKETTEVVFLKVDVDNNEVSTIAKPLYQLSPVLLDTGARHTAAWLWGTPRWK